MAVPYTFGTATSSIPLSQLDSNFNTVITLGNTAIQLGNTVTTLNNMTLANVTISSGNVTITNVAITTANVTTANITTAVIGTETVTTSTITTANVTTANITTDNITNGTVITSLTLSYGTANGVAYLNGSKVLTTGSALTFDGTNVGIGTSSPALKLHVVSSSAAVSYFETSDTATGAYVIWRNSSTSIGDVGSGKGISGSGNATDFMIASRSTYPLLFGTGSAERARIDSSGNLLVNRTSQFSNGQYSADFGGNSRRGATYNNTDANTGANFVSFGSSGTVIGTISQVGTTSVLYNTTSDRRLKENIQDADSASSLIDALQVRQFDWKTDNTHQRYGFIAQELVTVAPEAVHQPVNEDDMMAVDYSKLVPMLVKEIQSLRKRLADAGIA